MLVTSTGLLVRFGLACQYIYIYKHANTTLLFANIRMLGDLTSILIYLGCL